jgi:uncharacterized membrane protein
MIANFKNFIKMTILGGFFVILPIILFSFFVLWIGEFLIDIFKPLSIFYEQYLHLNIYICHVLSLASFLGICFSLGIVVKTQFGTYIHRIFEKILVKIPGYSMINDILNQFFRDKKSFRKVVLIDRLNNNVLETGFVTDEYTLKGEIFYSVFIPTGPNPTAGFIINIPMTAVVKESAKIDKAMKSVISCGAGTNNIWSDSNV